MEFVDKISNEFEKAAKSVVKETNKVIKSTKLSLSISDMEGKLEDIYKEIGRRYYDCISSGEADGADFEELIEKINEIKNEIDAARGTLLDIKNKARCTCCGSEIGKTDVFCKKCGERITD